MKPNQTLRYKPVTLGGKFNHFEFYLAYLGVALFFIALIVIFADKIDAFMNTKAGALTLVTVFGVIGIAWFVWRIKRIF